MVNCQNELLYCHLFLILPKILPYQFLLKVDFKVAVYFIVFKKKEKGVYKKKSACMINIVTNE